MPSPIGMGDHVFGMLLRASSQRLGCRRECWATRSCGSGLCRFARGKPVRASRANIECRDARCSLRSSPKDEGLGRGRGKASESIPAAVSPERATRRRGQIQTGEGRRPLQGLSATKPQSRWERTDCKPLFPRPSVHTWEFAAAIIPKANSPISFPHPATIA